MMHLRMLYKTFLCLVFSYITHAQPSVYEFSIDNRESVKPEITCLLQTSSGYIFCGSTKGLYRFNGIDFFSSDNKSEGFITALFEDADSVLWIGYNNGNIGFIKHKKFQLLQVEEGFPKVAVKSICQDKAGIIFFGTAGEGIYYLKSKRLFNVNEDDGLSDNYVYKLVYSAAYGMVASTDRGINFILPDNNNKNIRSITSKDGLPDNMVKAISMAGNKLYMG